MESHRLSTNVVPKHYALMLTPDLNNFTFKGEVVVSVEIKEPTALITLYASDLEIRSANARVFPSQQELSATPILDKKAETLSLDFKTTLPQGTTELRIAFSGKLNDQMCGFYRSKYVAKDGAERHLATTQFEATDARRCFPCWDEPACKATFDVTLVVPNDLDAISNMPVAESKSYPNGMREFHFTTTPIMSTYLLAFVVGKFDSIESKTKDGVLVRVFTMPGKSEQGRFALDVAAKTLELYNEYFAIPYPLPKCDLIAIPDFAAGAMENWGAITYRETALLIDPENSSAAARQRVAIVVAHELAHQWFGNLVTMQWWTDLWLNEGFASWIEYMGVNHLFPEWDIWTQFMADAYAPALRDDALRSTHPIEVEVHHPSEISEIFDAISYEKGASVIRMIEVYLGPDTFRDGLRAYLKRHQYSNAATGDLWQALEDVSGKPVRNIMESWTKQPGYPVLTLMNLGGDLFGIRQTRFLSSPLLTLTPEEEAQVWHIPIPLGITGASGKGQESLFMRQREAQVELSRAHGWVNLNAHRIGFLRVNYTPELWKALEKPVAQKEIGPIDRFGIASDLAALTRAGQLPTTQTLEMLQAYRNETNYTVWIQILGILGALKNLLAYKSCYEEFCAYARDIFAGVWRSVGWDARENESHLDSLLRALVLGAMGDYKDPYVGKEAGERWLAHLAGKKPLDPNLRVSVYAITASCAGQKAPSVFETMLKQHRASELQEEKNRYLRALGNFQDPLLLKRALEFSLSGDVRSQDTIWAIASVSENPAGRNLAWEFFKENWEEFNRRYSEGGLKLISRFVSSVGNPFTSEEKAQDVEMFFQTHEAPSARRAIARTLERIRANAAWLKKDGASIAEWLANRTKVQ
ncbi:MAG: M1 family metallopeptidase [bacterium]|nr:M1 family metallopeptidase [bacterium]